MTVATAASQRYAQAHKRSVLWHRIVGTLVWAFLLGNLAYIVYITMFSGDGDGLMYHWGSFTNFLIGFGRLTAFVAGYLAVIELILLARLPFLDRYAGFDKLTIWHRWNGHAVLYFSLAHVVATVWGYARQEANKTSFFQEYWNWLTLPQPHFDPSAAPAPSTPFKIPPGGLGLNGGGGLSINGGGGPATDSPYPGIITATIGTAILLLVLVTSLVIVRRKLSYEWWYVVHFTAYAAIAFAWFHMIPDGNELIAGNSHLAGWFTDANYWRGLYLGSVILIVYFRLLRPIVNNLRFGMKVEEVVVEGPGVISLRISGKGLDRLGTKAGQFFFWRFLAKGFWYTQHPYSISEAPQPGSLRITVKDLGDHSGRLAQLKPGTRVYAEGPFGVFTDEHRTGDKALLIGGGIGITPVRALLEEMEGDVITLYRAAAEEDVVFRAELDKIAKERGVRIDYIIGDHTTEEGRNLLNPEHLKQLVPDISERDVYICGPVAMIDAIVPNLRRVKVSRQHLHVERFAL